MKIRLRILATIHVLLGSFAFLGFSCLAYYAFATVISLPPEQRPTTLEYTVMIGLFLLAFLFSALSIVSTWFLWNLKITGWSLAFGIWMLLGFPIGTCIGVWTITEYVLSKKKPPTAA